MFRYHSNHFSIDKADYRRRTLGGQNRQARFRLKPKRSLIRNNNCKNGFYSKLDYRTFGPGPRVQIALRNEPILYKNDCDTVFCRFSMWSRLLYHPYLCFQVLPSAQAFSGNYFEWVSLGVVLMVLMVLMVEKGGHSIDKCDLVFGPTLLLLTMVTWDSSGRFTRLFVVVSRFTATLYCVRTLLCRSCVVVPPKRLRARQLHTSRAQHMVNSSNWSSPNKLSEWLG